MEKKYRRLVVFMCIPEMKPWRQHGHYTSINQLHEIVPDMSSQSSIMVNLVCLAISYTEKVAVGASLFVEKCKVHLGDHTQKLHFVVKGNSISQFFFMLSVFQVLGSPGFHSFFCMYSDLELILYNLCRSISHLGVLLSSQLCPLMVLSTI